MTATDFHNKEEEYVVLFMDEWFLNKQYSRNHFTDSCSLYITLFPTLEQSLANRINGILSSVTIWKNGWSLFSFPSSRRIFTIQNILREQFEINTTQVNVGRH